MKTKILSIILVIVMIVGMFSVGAIAEGVSNSIETTHIDNVTEEKSNYFYVENVTDSAATVTWTIKNPTPGSTKLKYSTDGETWNDLQFIYNTDEKTGSGANELPAKGKLYFYGDNPEGLSTDSSNYVCISGNVEHKVGGDITTLMNKDGNVSTITSEGAFYGLFRDDTNLIDASALILPSAHLAEACYMDMFFKCTNLTAGPNLPATQLAKWCYSGMFHSCTNLAAAPSELPATQLAEACYNSMFARCTSLETAPALPATQLADGCYSSMFAGCTSLETAPALPATQLAEGCYSSMFSECENLEKAPALPAAELITDCYWNMFFSCNKLSSVTVGFTEFGKGFETSDWLAKVANEGTFYAPDGFVEPDRGADTVPEGWTIETAMSPVHKHIYDDVTYIWNEDLTTCTAYHTCTYGTCEYTELETVKTVKDQEKITATFTKASFDNQTKMLADVTPQFYVSCYTEDNQCLIVGVPEKNGEAFNLTVPYSVYQDMNTAKLFTVNSKFEALRPEYTITK